MQAYGKREAQLFLRQLFHHGHKAAGGKADVAHADVHTLRAGDDRQEIHHIVEIIQRLANAHQHDVRNALARVGHDGVYLARYLACRKVSHAPALCGSAETAPHAAAHLCGHTHGVAIGIAHQHRLDAVAVRKAEQVFHRAVLRTLLAQRAKHLDGALLLQLLQKAFGQVCHGGKFLHALFVQPAEQLFGTKGRLSQPGDKARQHFQCVGGNSYPIHSTTIFPRML